jgi:Ca2+-binding RTX toxin-like protein
MRKFIVHARILHLRPTRLILLAVLAAALALGGAAVLAKTIDCPGSSCQGTNDNDTLRGTAVRDVVTGYGGADTISGRDGNDSLKGDDQSDSSLDGDDRISGGDGADLLLGHGGADVLIGGRDDDTINAQEFQNLGHPPGKDTVRGGRGNDMIYAADDVKDVIDCGPGVDYVLFDQNLDTVTGCETKDPA